MLRLGSGTSALKSGHDFWGNPRIHVPLQALVRRSLPNSLLRYQYTCTTFHIISCFSNPLGGLTFFEVYFAHKNAARALKSLPKKSCIYCYTYITEHSNWGPQIFSAAMVTCFICKCLQIHQSLHNVHVSIWTTPLIPDYCHMEKPQSGDSIHFIWQRALKSVFWTCNEWWWLQADVSSRGLTKNNGSVVS